MDDTQPVNEIARKLGNLLINKGIDILVSSFHLEPVKVSSDEITQTIKQYFPSAPITHLDSWYYLIPIFQWKQIIESDWISEKKWIIDARDCDNFANAFAANASMYFLLNSVGRVYGKLYKGTNQFLVYHYWNVIITPDKKIWFFEPHSDKLEETNYQGGMLLIGGNLYVPISFMFG